MVRAVSRCRSGGGTAPISTAGGSLCGGIRSAVRSIPRPGKALFTVNQGSQPPSGDGSSDALQPWCEGGRIFQRQETKGAVDDDAGNGGTGRRGAPRVDG